MDIHEQKTKAVGKMHYVTSVWATCSLWTQSIASWNLFYYLRMRSWPIRVQSARLDPLGKKTCNKQYWSLTSYFFSHNHGNEEGEYFEMWPTSPWKPTRDKGLFVYVMGHRKTDIWCNDIMTYQGPVCMYRASCQWKLQWTIGEFDTI